MGTCSAIVCLSCDLQRCPALKSSRVSHSPYLSLNIDQLCCEQLQPLSPSLVGVVRKSNRIVLFLCVDLNDVQRVRFRSGRALRLCFGPVIAASSGALDEEAEALFYTDKFAVN